MTGQSNSLDVEMRQARIDVVRWFAKHGGPLVVLVTAASIVGAIALGLGLWTWLSAGDQSNSSTLRNLGLAAAIPPTAVLALWRASVAERNAESARREADISHMSLRNERYKNGAELLASEKPLTRIGAIHELENLAFESPSEHLGQVVPLLCAFARHPPAHADQLRSNDAVDEADARWQPSDRPRIFATREDVVLAVWAAVRCCEMNRANPTGPRPQLDLNNVVLDRAVLTGIRLPGANLIDASLRDADLHGANLGGAELLLADLSDAILIKADLTRVAGGGATLVGAHLSRADCVGADLERADLANADLTAAILESATLTNAKLQQAVLRKANLQGTMLRGADLSGADLTDVDLSQADLTQAKLVGAILIGADLSGADLRGAKLWGADLHGATLTDADLTLTEFSKEYDDYSDTDALAEKIIHVADHMIVAAHGLTQQQLNRAMASVGYPPNLSGLTDHQTGQALTWFRGTPA